VRRFIGQTFNVSFSIHNVKYLYITNINLGRNKVLEFCEYCQRQSVENLPFYYTPNIAKIGIKEDFRIY
jgi:hypothetical protein